jgi:beta-1,4-mannosyltransferase
VCGCVFVSKIFDFSFMYWYANHLSLNALFLLQNPPSVPTLVVVKWASSLRHSAFVIDWHNFGYTLLGLSLGRSSCFVSVYRW